MRQFFERLFSDTNDINEKAIIGMVSFLIMVVYSGIDVFYAATGRKVEINETVYSSFETIVLGAFLISSGEKIAKIVSNESRVKKNSIRQTKKREIKEEEGAEGQEYL